MGNLQPRADVPPLTWEVPVAIVLSWIIASGLAMPTGQALAYAITGHGLRWPARDLVESIGGLTTGHLGAGVDGPNPNPTLVYLLIAISEVAVGVLALWVTALWWRTIGPGADYGLASKHEIRSVLGERRLLRSLGTIRPDLASRKR